MGLPDFFFFLEDFFGTTVFVDVFDTVVVVEEESGDFFRAIAAAVTLSHTLPNAILPSVSSRLSLR
jgi:hypothetical protein